MGQFKTTDTPRILSIDGLYNVRDIGNWKTDSGKRIKQGLLIRGTEMDGAAESIYHLTNGGLADMLGGFGIKTDMDLRAQTATSKDALGSRVDHRYYDMVMYGGIFSNTGKEKIRTVFSDLANPDNYPIYLHCTYGCDRTGTVCYILEALLGVSRGDCLKDYGLSNLNIKNIKAVEEGLKAYPGNSLKEQAESYLLSCGVTEYQIKSIRNIFLGE
jgi:protein-tyrosine phosphatase